MHADVTNYGNPIIVGDYNIRLHGEDLAVISTPVQTVGDVSLTGNIHYQNENDRPILRSLVVKGLFGSEAFSASSSAGRLELRKLQGKYELANGSLRADGVGAEILGGQINADINVQNLDGTPTSRVRTILRNISLQAAQQAVHGAAGNQVAISGKLDGTGDASWTGSVSNIRVRSDLGVRADARNATNRSGTHIPVNAAIHAMYDGPTSVLTLRQTTFRIPSTTLTAEGQVSKRSNLQIHGASNDLHQLVALVSAFSSSSSAPPVVSGTANLNANVTGSMQKPQISGQVRWISVAKM